MPGKKWDDEDESSSGSGSEASQPAVPAGALRRVNKFEDEEDEDSDVLDSWDADDSEVEREKAKKAAEAKAQEEAAKAAAAAAKKPKGKRIADRISERARMQDQLDAEAAALDGETEAERRERLRRNEQDADLQHAADLFGDAGLSAGTGTRKSAAVLKASAVAADGSASGQTVNLAALPLLNPTTKAQFDQLRTTLSPLLAAHAKKPHYALFVQDLVKELCKPLPSEQIKKQASALSALGNDRLREEKAADKGGKKTKAAKTKTSLAVARPNTVDTGAYDDDYGDDDFM